MAWAAAVTGSGGGDEGSGGTDGSVIIVSGGRARVTQTVENLFFIA